MVFAESNVDKMQKLGTNVRSKVLNLEINDKYILIKNLRFKTNISRHKIRHLLSQNEFSIFNDILKNDIYTCKIKEKHRLIKKYNFLCKKQVSVEQQVF